MEEENKAYQALMDEGGTPAYPLDLVLDIFDQAPGQYSDIVSYWSSRLCSGEHCVFREQLKAWRMFRYYQLRIRQHFIKLNDFPEYQRRVSDRRRRHGLEGDLTILEDRDKQSKLEQWMEYQDINIKTMEDLQQSLENAKQKRISTQQALDEAGLPGFDAEFEVGRFSTELSLCLKQGDEKSAAFNKVTLARQELDLAGKRLQTAQSDRFGQTIDMTAWVRSFQEEADDAWMQLSKVPTSGYRAEDWHQGGRFSRREDESKEDWWDAERKRRKVQSDCYNAEVKAEQRVRFAEKALQAAQIDHFGEAIEKTALVGLISAEIELAQTQFDETKAALEKVQLRGNALGALCEIAKVTSNLRQHKLLVDWIEQQRQALAHSHDKGRRPRSARISATQASRTSRPFDGSVTGTKRKRPQSVLNAIDPSRVSKARQKGKTTALRRKSVSIDASKTAEAAGTDSNLRKRGKERSHNPIDAVPPPLRAIHASKVAKCSGRQRSSLQKSGTSLPQKTAQLGSKRELRRRQSSGATHCEPRSKRAELPTRKSARVAKQVEMAFAQGY